jgi:hypothetical protein
LISNVVTQLTEPKERPPEVADGEDYNRRSIGIGVACTVLFHVLLLWLSPQFGLNKFSGKHTGISVLKPNQGKSFDFQLTPDIEKPKDDPSKFVETNPDAPENTPDKTANFSNRNQQSAQKEAAKEKDPENRPSVKGQDEIKNDSAIVTGDLSKPQQGAAAAPEVTKTDSEKQQAELKARAEQTPLSGFEKNEGKSEDGIATNISKASTPSTHADQLVEGAHDAKDPTGGLVAANQTAKAQPKARPRLTAARSTILTNRATGTTNIGILGQDARWSEYGEYLNEMLEIIQVQWYKILRDSRVSPPRGSHVVITFKINSKGETDIVKVEDADSGKQGVFSCQNAITIPQPYRKWTEQMIAVLGDEQQLTLSFYYQ